GGAFAPADESDALTTFAVLESVSARDIGAPVVEVEVEADGGFGELVEDIPRAPVTDLEDDGSVFFAQDNPVQVPDGVGEAESAGDAAPGSESADGQDDMPTQAGGNDGILPPHGSA